MDNEKFKRLISMIESAGGKNTNHKTITAGIHKGHRAIGKYGLLPNTIDEFVARATRDNNAHPLEKALVGTTPEQKYQMFAKNPELEEIIANRMTNFVMKKQGDPERAAFSWNQGHNIDPKNIGPDKLNNADYVQKFRKFGRSLHAPKLRQMAKKGAPKTSDPILTQAEAEFNSSMIDNQISNARPKNPYSEQNVEELSKYFDSLPDEE